MTPPRVVSAAKVFSEEQIPARQKLNKSAVIKSLCLVRPDYFLHALCDPRGASVGVRCEDSGGPSPSRPQLLPLFTVSRRRFQCQPGGAFVDVWPGNLLTGSVGMQIALHPPPPPSLIVPTSRRIAAAASTREMQLVFGLLLHLYKPVKPRDYLTTVCFAHST